jgi:hypothetical protein
MHLHFSTLVAFALFLWVLFDIFGPTHVPLQELDAEVMARIQREIWEDQVTDATFDWYFREIDVMRLQYGYWPFRAALNGYRMMRARQTFLEERSVREDQKVLRYLVPYYAGIAAWTGLPFKPKEMAEREMDGWVQYREHPLDKKGLAKVIAAATSTFYGIPTTELNNFAFGMAKVIIKRDTSPHPINHFTWVDIETGLLTLYQELGHLYRPAGLTK